MWLILRFELADICSTEGTCTVPGASTQNNPKYCQILVYRFTKAAAITMDAPEDTMAIIWRYDYLTTQLYPLFQMGPRTLKMIR